ncbi:MAG: hypothetical protein QG594_1809 [Bacteroidota bacterium]|nr:hypothetical protein [Bacteroidota bacterium]
MNKSCGKTTLNSLNSHFIIFDLNHLIGYCTKHLYILKKILHICFYKFSNFKTKLNFLKNNYQKQKE